MFPSVKHVYGLGVYLGKGVLSCHVCQLKQARTVAISLGRYQNRYLRMENRLDVSWVHFCHSFTMYMAARYFLRCSQVM